MEFLAYVPAIGVIVTAAGVAVTVGIFIAKSRDDRQAAALAARRQAISRVLDTVERASRAHALLPLSRLWTRPEMEIALVLPRLVLELDPVDRDVATWVARRVQRMQLARSDTRALGIAQSIGFELAAWHHGERELTWFSEQLQRDPFEATFRVPRSTRWRRGFKQSRDAALLAAMVAAIAIAWQSINSSE